SRRADECLRETEFQGEASLLRWISFLSYFILENISLRLRLRKLPSSIENFFPRAIETHHVVPAVHNRQAVGNLTVTTAEDHIALGAVEIVGPDGDGVGRR